MNKFRPIAIDIFAGCGGFSYGVESCGFDVLAALDIDKTNCETYKQNFPYSSIFCRDIRDTSAQYIRDNSSINNQNIDLVFGSPPCQGFSLAGKRDINDSRNLLIFEFLRLILELKPKYFVIENVSNLTSAKFSHILQKLITDFENSNYEIQKPYQILDSSNFGIPQQRKRLFLMGCREDLLLPNYPKPITKSPNSKTLSHLPNCPTIFDAIADLPKVENYPELFEKDWIINPEYGDINNHYASRMRGLTRADDDYSYFRNVDSTIFTGCQLTKHSPEVIKRFLNTLPEKREPISHFHRLKWDGIAPTILAGSDHSKGNFTGNRPIHPDGKRLCTNRELARIQSFPDSWEFSCIKTKALRQLGNGVPPLLGKAIGKEIIKVLGVTPFIPATAYQITHLPA